MGAANDFNVMTADEFTLWIVFTKHFCIGLMQAATYFGMESFSKVGFKAVVSPKILKVMSWVREIRTWKENF